MEIPSLSLLISDWLMLYVKVKEKNVRFTILIPYTMLNICISILSSKSFYQRANKWTKEYCHRKNLDFTFPLIDKETLKPIVKELKNHSGTVLVDVKAKDGTEVKIRL